MQENFKKPTTLNELNELIEFYDNIISLMPGHVYWKNKDGVLLGCNDLQAKSAGLSSRKEIVGKTDYDMPWKDQADILRNIDLEIIKTGMPKTIEEPSTLADGSEAIFLSKKVPLRDKNGEVIGILGISFDITELKRTKKALVETQTKLDGMTLVSTSIAHELRTPLASLNMNVDLLKDALPHLLETYKLAKEKGFATGNIRPTVLALLENKSEAMEKEIRASFTFIDMLLLNLAPVTDMSKIELFSISKCIKEALSRYPFLSSQEPLIQWKQNDKDDFMVKGEPLLMTHVLFNLIKNALHYIAKAGKGNAQIWLERGENTNKLFFKDTGTGISADVLPYIFTRFFSNTQHGAGVGLTFCQKVMQDIGGQITCESVEGDYTLFILSFPKQGNVL